MLQLLSADMSEIERVPSSSGLEIGAVYYSSSLNEESVTCFKIGICHYQFITPHFAFVTNIDWLTPSFRDNNFDIKIGFKYFFFSP